MDRKIKKYAQIISDFLADYAATWTSESIEYQFIADTQQFHYQVIKSGWDKSVFRHLIIFHFQIKPNGKVWLYVNRTDIEIGNEFMTLGIPKSDIILAFQPEKFRALEGYAVA
jgi:XisI protein